MIKYKLKRVPGEDEVYLCTCKDVYDLCMLFCRVQEFYESPFKQIRGKHFEMTTFMKLYSKKFGNGTFSYADDWAGFNVPSKVIEELYKKGELIDLNSYDAVFLKIVGEIRKQTNKEYYLIGSRSNDTSTVEHEMCHAKFALNKKYKKQAMELIRSIPKPILFKIERHLLSIGYSKKTLKDEVQAYVTCDYQMLIENIAFTEREEKKLFTIHSSINE